MFRHFESHATMAGLQEAPVKPRDLSKAATEREILKEDMSPRRDPLFNSSDKTSSRSFEKIFGFNLSELKSWNSAVALMFRPEDPSSLAVARILYGLLMAMDIPEERGLSEVDVRWGDALKCHFPLLPFLDPPTLPWMCMVYLTMWIGAIGIMLGYHFKTSCVLFAVPYWYILLLDTSTWNNHSYLFGLVAILFIRTSAHHCWSIDALLNKWIDRPVPLWNYAALRFQFFILYFLAGLKKTDPDWLGGYSMTYLGNHWVFLPFQLLLPPYLVDYLIVHITGFILDLTIGFWMFFDKTRPIAFLFCGAFHFMNSRLFEIGMFPYVCLATMPLFCHNNWPRLLTQRQPLKWILSWRRKRAHNVTKPWSEPELYEKEILDGGCLLPNHHKKENNCSKEGTKTDDHEHTKSRMAEENESCEEAHLEGKRNLKDSQRPTWRQKLTVSLLMVHVFLQFFLPYSHFITKGYNNWTNGLYGYSWDMMVHTWDTILVVVKVVDKDTGEEFFMDPEAFVRTNRWVQHGDMVRRYAKCVQRNLKDIKRNDKKLPSPDNIEIYIDAWCSLNGRFQQRMYDPRIDILAARWSPFEPLTYGLPLLTELSSWRSKIVELERQVYSWSEYSDAMFVADFPGLYLEHYVTEVTNVSLTLLSGEVIVELWPGNATLTSNRTLNVGESTPIPLHVLHRVHTTSTDPACYMYAYTRKTAHDEQAKLAATETMATDITGADPGPEIKTFKGRMKQRWRNFRQAVGFVSNALLHLLYSVPMAKRVRLN